VGKVPPITQWVPNLPKVYTAFGILIPKGVPPEVVETVEKLWMDRVANSEAFKKYAAQRGALFTPAVGKTAHDMVWPTVISDAWLLQEAGMAKISPEQIGIPKPTK
jgi:tripartite-type tricarboxylate transporter receptor subunit TctC